MSIPAFAWALEQGAALKLSPAERLVLVYLADKANGARVCWPGQETIRRFTGLALNTVASAVRKLAGHNLIRVEDSPGRVTRYHILRDETPANGERVAKPNGRDIHNPRKSDGGAPANGEGVSHANPRKCEARPPQMRGQTPANERDEPYLTKKRTLERRAQAREAADIDSGIKEAQQASPPQQPEPEEARVSPEAVASLARSLGRRLQSPHQYPPRPSGLAHHEQIAACQGPPPPERPLTLNPAVAAAVLAARAALAAQVRP